MCFVLMNILKTSFKYFSCLLANQLKYSFLGTQKFPRKSNICNVHNPSKHTTSFRHPYNIHNVKTKSYGCQNNVVCVLGCLHNKKSRYSTI